MKQYWWIGIFFAGLLLPACDEGEPIDYTEPGEGMDYFIPETGDTWTYRMDSLLYDLKSGNEVLIDTVASFLRYEVIGNSTLSNGTREIEIEREYRPSDTSQWSFYDRIHYSISESEFLVKEGNISIQRAIFPLSEDRTWNPTKYTDSNIEIFIKGEPIEMFQYWSGSVQQYDSTATVLGEEVSLVHTTLADFTSLIELRRAEEVYAKGIGLVSRELWILDTQCEQFGGDPIACDGMPWNEIANRGFILKQQLLAYE